MMMLNKLFRRGLSCSDVLEVLQSYLDGETDEETARKVLSHLDSCERCDDEAEVYKQIKGSLQKKAPPLDPDIMSALTRFGERVARGEVS